MKETFLKASSRGKKRRVINVFNRVRSIVMASHDGNRVYFYFLSGFCAIVSASIKTSIENVPISVLRRIGGRVHTLTYRGN